jgi:hypothetical protein
VVHAHTFVSSTLSLAPSMSAMTMPGVWIHQCVPGGGQLTKVLALKHCFAYTHGHTPPVAHTCSQRSLFHTVTHSIANTKHMLATRCRHAATRPMAEPMAGKRIHAHAHPPTTTTVHVLVILDGLEVGIAHTHKERREQRTHSEQMNPTRVVQLLFPASAHFARCVIKPLLSHVLRAPDDERTTPS